MAGEEKKSPPLPAALKAAPAPVAATGPATASAPGVASARGSVPSAKPAPSPAADASPAAALADGDCEAVRRLAAARKAVVGEVHKAIVGMEEPIDLLLTGIFAKGHCLMEGVPGLAKTFLVSTLARTISLDFKRVQFTPDLMPADIIGSEILQDDPLTGQRRFKFLPGPVFTNLLLADEINRTPPKTQAALLEAMQERQVSVSGENHRLGPPFFVLATQNPLEQEGTYPLPEAQLDRFIFKIYVDYPSYAEEIAIMKAITGAASPTLSAILSREDIVAMQELVRRVPIADHVMGYAARLARATRPREAEAPAIVRKYVGYGAGPRASLNLVLAAKARAALHGRFHAAVEDIRAVAKPVMRHRLAVNFAAQAEGVTADGLVDELLRTLPEAP